MTFNPSAFRAARKQAVKSFEELGIAVGRTASAICHYETGRRTPSPHIQQALASELGVRVENFYTDGLPERPPPPTVPLPPTLLTAHEVAEWLGVSSAQVYKLARGRELPHLRVNSLVRFDRDEIRRWLDSHRVPMMAIEP